MIQRPRQSRITDELASFSVGIQGLRDANLLQDEGHASCTKSYANFAETFKNT